MEKIPINPTEDEVESQCAEKTIEQQANCKENDGLLFISRLNNPIIRGQLIDLICVAEQSKIGEFTVRSLKDSQGKDIKDEQGRYQTEKIYYVPKTREEVEALFDEKMKAIQSDTPISFDPRETPHLIGGREIIPMEYVFPVTGEKLTPKQMSIMEAHEKGHVIRPTLHYEYINNKFQKAFDQSKVQFTDEDYRIGCLIFEHYPNEKVPSFEEAREISLRYLFSGQELIERMSQLKNYFGMKGIEIFTKEHLQYAREHYIQDTGMDNNMAHFFQAITSKTEDAFIEIINSGGV